MLEKDHSCEVAELEELLGTAMSAFAKIRAALSFCETELNVDDPDFDGGTMSTLIDLYLNQLGYISKEAASLNPYLLSENVSVAEIYRAIESLNEYSVLAKALTREEEAYKQRFGGFYAGRETDWDNIVSLLRRANEVLGMDMYEELKPVIAASEERKKELEKSVNKILPLIIDMQSHFRWLDSQFESDEFSADITLWAASEKAGECLSSLHMLGGWIDYLEAKDACHACGLEDFIEKIEEAKIRTDIEKVFLKGFYHMWLGAVCDKSASLRRFRRNTHDERIKKFIELDDLQLLIAQMRIREKLIENLPSHHHLLKATDEVAILKKELGKKRNIMPLRKLFRLIPNLLMKLKPCLMMSPLSVSYFLETEAYHFDLVIFDEASQIFPEDAIGAIFRGSQVVIAGDSKQLPPTNFFAANANNFDGDYDMAEEDFGEAVSDSILEETASVLPNRTLLWHYRSKHESLIAFSNREIYKTISSRFRAALPRFPIWAWNIFTLKTAITRAAAKTAI